MINNFIVHKCVDVNLASTDWTLAGDAEAKRTTPPDAIYLGSAVGGTIVAQLSGHDAAKTFTALAGGVWHPMSVVAITKTGTDAALQTDGVIKVGWTRP